MCCSSKKKPIPEAPTGVQANPSGVQSSTSGQPKVQNPALQSSTAVGSAAGSQMTASKIQFQNKMVKSQVVVKTIPDPETAKLFKDSQAQKLHIIKKTLEHNSYVRQKDYFDMSNGHTNEVNQTVVPYDRKHAQYGVPPVDDLSTPAINTFYYNQEAHYLNYPPGKDSLARNTGGQGFGGQGTTIGGQGNRISQRQVLEYGGNSGRRGNNGYMDNGLYRNGEPVYTDTRY